MPLLSSEEINKWNGKFKGQMALIESLDMMSRRMPSLAGNRILTSGGFAPVHPGHISSFYEAKNLNKPDGAYDRNILIVLVNSDDFLISKHGAAFMDHKTRCQIVASFPWVDYVVPWYPTKISDMTVNEALEVLKPDIFAKGGDRCSPDTIPEWDVCERLGIKVVSGLGAEKNWSSSEFLNRWFNEISS